MIIEIKRQRRLVDDEKETFKTRLKNSFDAIILPVSNQGEFNEILRNKKEEHFTNFDEETEEVDQESEYKRNVKRELESYANEKINEMIEKNGISFTIATIVCNVSNVASFSSLTFVVSNGRRFLF